MLSHICECLLEACSSLLPTLEFTHGAGFIIMSRYNCENGGPAPERLTNAIYQNTTKIKEYWTAEESLSVDLDKLGTTQFMVQHQDGKFGPFAVEVRPCSTQPWSKPKEGAHV